ncbi:hypothetical protein GCM10029978_058680 [Actinoallomurus acanthiterrae]
MRQKAARFGATLAVAGALAAGTLSVATPADASTTGWVGKGAYRTLEGCLDGATAILVAGPYTQYDCRWDSPYWELWVR